jgi:NTP pyrophosphatase (non-canonical NTP hydrolase)
MNIYDQALNHFGIDAQKIKAIEEMAELTQAICKDTNIAEEIADVQILLEQLKIVYPEWEKYKLTKLNRLKSIIV